MSQTVKVFERRSILKTTLDRVIVFHQDPRALNRLTPPPIIVRLNRDDRRSLTKGELDFTLWFGPFPIRWIARHSPGPNEHSFVDEMTTGPMAYWYHEHIIEPVHEGVLLYDRVVFAHKSGLRGLLTRLVFDGLPLRLLFFYRHLRTRTGTS